MTSGPSATSISRIGPIGRLIVQRPLAIIVIAALLAVAGAVLASARLELDADTNHLIAPDRPFMVDFEAWLEEFGDLERLVVVVDPGDGTTLTADAAVLDLLDRLERLATGDDLLAVHGRISAPEQWRLAARAMPMAELDELVSGADAMARLAGDASADEILAEGVARLRTLSSPAALRLDDEARRRTGIEGVLLLGSLAAAADDVSADAPADPVRLGTPRPDQWLVNPGGRLRFIEILPRKDFGSLAAIEAPLAAIRETVAEVGARHPGIEIGVTGKPVLQADELATSDADMRRCAAGALLIIALIFIRAFRGWRRPLLMVLTFAIAFGWSYGAATILVGRLNLLSIVFMLVLVGVGLDYGVHVTTRWMACRRSGRSIESAVAETLRTAAAGNISGAVTSAGVFLIALLTDFGGLRELGVVAGTGLLLCVVAMNTVLPAMLVLDEGRHPVPSGIPETPASTMPTASPPAAGRGPSIGILVLAAAITIALGVVVASRARFEDNLLDLQADGLASVDWEHRVLADSTSASWFAASIADSMPEVAALVDAAGREPTIGSTRSVLDLMPIQTAERDRRLETLAAITATESEAGDDRRESDGPASPIAPDDWRLAAESAARLAALARPRDAAAAEDLDAIGTRLAILAEAGVREPTLTAAAVDASRRRARDAVRALCRGASGDLRAALPPAVRDRLVAPSGRFLVSLVPAEDVWSPEPMGRFVEAIRRVDPHVTGVPITQFESLRDMRRSFLEMAAGASLLVAMIVWIDFRRLRRMLAIMTVLGIGLLWTIGITTLLGVHLNVANFFAIPILIGLGVDSAIHLLHRVDECGDGPIDLADTRRAVVLTVVTTGIGFGSLIFARHRGLESLGVVMAIGSGAILLATLGLLPAMIRLGRGRRGG